MNKPMNKLFIIVMFISFPAQAAPSGADALLESLGKSVVTAPELGAPVTQTAVHLDNPVALKLFSDWNQQKGLSFELNAWVQKFLGNDFEGFAHLKSVMESDVSKIETTSFKNSLTAAYVYSLFRLNLHHSFMNEWLKSMENEIFSNSESSIALDQGIVAIRSIENTLVTNHIRFNPAQIALIKKVGTARHVNWLNLNAYVLQRQGITAEPVLAQLPMNSVLRPRLSMTVALAYARKGDLANAAKTLKIHYEPWMNQSQDPTSNSKYALEIARLLYQAGSLDGAVQYYQKIPKGSADYITAREELSWAWLRQGNLSQLRGNLATLTSAVMADQFRPESALVKAISNLKLCNYSEVENDFKNFISNNSAWAKKIETNIQSPESALPRMPDEFSLSAMALVKSQESEIKELEGLAVRSGSAALPAIGIQKHWTDTVQSLKLTLENSKKTQANEFRRQWKSDKTMLQEAIRKMQFVKVELLSQLTQEQALTRKDAVPAIQVQSAKNKIKSEGDHSFPFDGVVWPDELFKLKAVTNTQCSEKL